jgi:hypothetical protein
MPGRTPKGKQMTKPKTKPAPAPDAKTYDVVWGIKHRGTRYEPGEQADLTDDEAAPFVATGAIALPVAEAQAEAEVTEEQAAPADAAE